jgi:glycosyltransferase involved in cell wall biosynthesis
MPLFSIIVPTYNRADKLRAVIDCVLKQSFQDWELLVIDDGSTDQTAGFFKTITDPRIRYYYQTNQERSAARNKGIKLAYGTYICFLDSDDVYFPEHLSILQAAIREKNFPVAMFHTHTIMTHPDGREEKTKIFSLLPGETTSQLYMRNFIGTNCVCIHAQILKTFQFDPELNRAEDSNLFFRITARYPVIDIPVFSTNYYMSDTDRNPAALLKNHQGYILAWQRTFSDEKVKLAIPVKERNKRLSECYNWMLQDCYLIIPWRAFVNDLLHLIALKPSSLLTRAFWKVVYTKLVRR